MQRRRAIRREVLIGVGTYLLAAGGGVLIGKTLAIGLVAVGSLFLLLAGASTAPAQRRIPYLARLPFVAPVPRIAESNEQAVGVPLPPNVIDRRIRAADYAPIVHGHTFERCEFAGTVHLPGSHVEHSKWLLGRFMVVRRPERDLPEGTLSFVDCTFSECVFKDCTGVGTAEQIASLRAIFDISDDDPSYPQ